MPVLYFDRAAFDATAPTPTLIDYQAIVLENNYLRLTFIPQLGGRLYSAIIKSTGQEIFYHNDVVKPSRYGILQPIEANWWLAMGGMEWAYPTQEHGYRWGVPWSVSVAQSDNQATITLSDIEPGRVGVTVDVTLQADTAWFSVHPRLINAGSTRVPVQFWTNAVLSLAPDTMSAQTQFVIPTEEITVHSRGAEGWSVPDAHTQIPWPHIDATDLRTYTHWANYLGFFAPYLNAPFMGAYNPEADLGVARLIEPGIIPGNKLFAFGSAFPDRSYTDGDSQYFEIWGGINTGFWPEDDIQVSSGAELSWEEAWWPLAGLGGLTWANDQAAIHLTNSSEAAALSVLVAQPMAGRLTISTGNTVVVDEPFTARPTAVFRQQFSASGVPLRIVLTDEVGEVILEYRTR